VASRSNGMDNTHHHHRWPFPSSFNCNTLFAAPGLAMAARKLRVSERMLAPDQVIAFTTVILIVGLAISTLLPDRIPGTIVEISGSPTPPEYASRSVANLLQGGDFVTRAPDGEAYAQVRFAAPVSLSTIAHRYPAEVWPQYRVREAAIQWSDDGLSWTEAARVVASGEAMIFNVSGAQAHREWRLLVLESGEAPEVVIGNLSFQRSDNAPQTRFPVDLAWLLLAPALLLLLVSFERPLTRERAVVIAAIPIGLFVVAYSFGYAPYHVLIAPDSFGYAQAVLTGTFSESRNSGYQAFLLFVGKTSGIGALPLIQLGIELLCYVLAVRLVVRRFRVVWLGPVMLLMFCLQGLTTSFAPWILPESLFTAGLVLFAASLASGAHSPTTSALAQAAIGLVLATAAKSVGIVLIGPAILLMRFMPRGTRLRAIAILVTPALATYAAMTVHAYHRTGYFAAETFAGFALIGHVGWMLNTSPQGQPAAAEAMQNAIEPLLAQRPSDLLPINSRAALERYIDYTTSEYNQILWLRLLPAAGPYFTSGREMDAYFLRLSLSSIVSRPLDYAMHVGAHFYGLWRDIGRSFLDLPAATVVIRRYPKQVPHDDRKYYESFGRLVGPWPSDSQTETSLAAQPDVPLALMDFWKFFSTQTWVTEHTVWVGWLAVLLSALFLLPGRVSWFYRSEIMLALSINSYFLGHALFQVTLGRYAGVTFPAVVVLTFSFMATTLQALSGTRR
jgi:hypothetical protein